MSNAIHRLKNYTIETGSPFPFVVETVHDIESAEPAPLAIATDGKRFKVADSEGDNSTPNALRQIVKQLAPELTEYQYKPDNDSGTPET